MGSRKLIPFWNRGPSFGSKMARPEGLELLTLDSEDPTERENAKND